MMYFFIIYTDSELLHYNGFPQQAPKANSESVFQHSMIIVRYFFWSLSTSHLHIKYYLYTSGNKVNKHSL